MNFPVPAEATELIENGDFTVQALWGFFAGWTISTGKARYTEDIGGALWQAVDMIAGHLYKLEFDVDAITINANPTDALYAQIGPLVEPPDGTNSIVTTGTKRFFLEATDAVDPELLFAQGNKLLTCVIDNVSLIEFIAWICNVANIVPSDRTLYRRTVLDDGDCWFNLGNKNYKTSILIKVEATP